MKLTRATIVVYVALIFGSGAVLGAFGHSLFVVSSVNAKATKNADEFRKKVIAEYKVRMNLTDQQIGQLNQIFDETRASVEEARQILKPAYERIHVETNTKIRAILNADQQVEFDKISKERDQRLKESGRLPGPGF